MPPRVDKFFHFLRRWHEDGWCAPQPVSNRSGSLRHHPSSHAPAICDAAQGRRPLGPTEHVPPVGTGPRLPGAPRRSGGRHKGANARAAGKAKEKERATTTATVRAAEKGRPASTIWCALQRRAARLPHSHRARGPRGSSKVYALIERVPPPVLESCARGIGVRDRFRPRTEDGSFRGHRASRPPHFG